ncbi:uncharacterized protein FTOL_02110 [Fusarium torulosum]|uniref:Uncharacterized protein n=1 Tax=Fusarium torulosum TaxID=33205 RepID=A0AAE8M1H1_9HYPO|nr:uncharacterized protein FTOL_02110 [Fusarium torulosum]
MVSIKLLRLALCCAFLFLQIPAMLAIWIGVPSAPVYFTWFIIEQLSPDLPEELKNQALEAVMCLIFHTMFFSIVLWGLLPYYSMRPEMSPSVRGLVSCSFGLLTEALTIFAMHVAFVSWNWSGQFDAGGNTSLASHCRAIAVFLVVLWSLGWGAFLIFLSIAVDFGIPSWIRQMLIDMRKLLAVLRIQPEVSQDSASATEKKEMMDINV